MANENGWIKLLVKSLIGFSILALITVIGFMGDAIDANDKTNTKDHTEMRKETEQKVSEAEKNFDKKVEKIVDKQEIMLVQQTRILTLLEGMNNETQ